MIYIHVKISKNEDLMMRPGIFLTFLSVFITVLDLQGADNSQWRGPNRNGIYPEKNLLKAWPPAGPKLLWSVTGLGVGHSSAAVAAGRVYVTGMVQDTGYLFAFDMNGKLLWKKPYGKEWDEGHPGARTTPTVYDGQIYLMSGYGRVVCFDATKGNELWSLDLVKSYGARNLRWGMTESLLVDGDRVFCTPGGKDATIVALDRLTGKTIWQSSNGQKSAYCSPTLVQHGNTRLLLTMTAESIVALNPTNGKIVWQYPHITRYDINPNTPIYHDGFIYCTSGYGTGSVKLKLSADGKSVKEIWRNKILDSQMGAAVLVNGYIYGSGHSNKGWHCLDWETGEIKFSSNDLGRKGNIIYADGLMYCYGEKGDIGLVKPDPKFFNILSSFVITMGTAEHWAHLVVADGRLYVRHGDVLMVYSISAS